MLASSRSTSALIGWPCSASISSTPRRTRSISSCSSARARSAAAEIPGAPDGSEGSTGLGAAFTAAILGAGGAGTGGVELQRVEAVVADRQRVTVVQGPELDVLAVEEDAVEAAVVEDPHRLPGFGDDEGVAAGDAGVVEPEVGVGGAGDPGPAVLDREGDDLAVVALESEAEAGARLLSLARPLEPARRLVPVRRLEFAGGRVVLARLEDRVATVLRAAAARAVGKLVGLLPRELRAAAEAEERPLAGGRPGLVTVVRWAAADAVEDGWPPPSCGFVPLGTILARPVRCVTQIGPMWG